MCYHCVLCCRIFYMCHEIGMHFLKQSSPYLLCMILFFLYSFQVFSAFGYVHKIATFEKAAGFQVRVKLHASDM